jgi:DNA-binding beta-propeller fold protein YncE
VRRLAVFLLAAGLPGGIDAETLLVANKREATLTFVDPDSGIVRAAIPTGLDPHQVEVSGDGRRAVVSMYGTDGKPGSTITVVDVDVPSGKELRTVELEGFTRPPWRRRPRVLRALESQRRTTRTAASAPSLAVI